MATTNMIEQSTARVTLPGGRVATYKWPVMISTVMSEPELRDLNTPADPTVAALVNGIVTSLVVPLPVHVATVEPVPLRSSEGASLYRRSLVFLMAAAAYKEFGSAFHVCVEHALAKNAYLCAVDNDREVKPEEIDRLRDRMRQMVNADIPVTEDTLAYSEALAHFRSTGRPYSEAAVETSNAECTRVTVVDGYAALYFRAVCARTGVLTQFDLWRMGDGHGFALVFPRKHEAIPTHREEVDDPTITAVYREYNSWGRLLNVSCAGQLNKKILRGESKNFVAVSEALQGHKIVEIALAMRPRIDQGLKMVLIAGPSASGKTTFASKLGIQLKILGCEPVVLSVDNYFKPRTETPLDEKGEYDFEALEALRVDLLNDHLVKLMKGETVETPIFDFTTGMPKTKTIRVTLPKNGILIMEGIHMLNEKLTPLVPREAKFKIFLAPLSQLNLDELNFTSHAVGRLIRRVVRDYNCRGFTARDTLARWESVTKGEEKHIFPFMHEADVVFNTALDYETSVLKVYVAPLLRSVTPDMEQYNTARNLLWILDSFFPIPHDDVPPNSLLREFIGGSFFEDV